jgi:hypothetical protein
LLQKCKEIFKQLEVGLSGGQSPVFQMIKNTFIRGWGKEHVIVSANIFEISSRRVHQILEENPPESYIKDAVGPRKKNPRIRESARLWISQLLQNLVTKKSGEKSDTTLRSQYSKGDLYELFQKGWYVMALDEQINETPDLIKEAMARKKTTRFLRNIRLLQKHKTKNNLLVYKIDPLKEEPIPGIKPVDYRTFFRALKREKITLVFDYVPYNCHICNSLPSINQKIKDIQEGKEKATSTQRFLQVWQQKKMNVLLHQAQLQTQRGEITRIREQLNYKQCHVIQDFVGHYTSWNKKIYQLVFVHYFRTQLGMSLGIVTPFGA